MKIMIELNDDYELPNEEDEIIDDVMKDLIESYMFTKDHKVVTNGEVAGTWTIEE